MASNAQKASIQTYNQEELNVGLTLSNFDTTLASKGWKVKGHTPSDGNCFFWAVSSQLEMHSPDKLATHSQLRADTASYLENISEVS